MCCEHSHRCRPMSTTSFFAVVPTSICASNLRRGPPTNNKQQGGPMMTDSKGVFLIFGAIEMNRLLSESSPKPISVSGSSGSASWDIGKFILIIMKLLLREGNREFRNSVKTYSYKCQVIQSINQSH